MGNRGGCIHSGQREIVRQYKGRSWITCRLEFKGRRREVMAPELYTELFFLDEGQPLRQDIGRVRSALAAANLKIIANSSGGASSVSAEEQKAVFLATKTSLSDGSRVESVLEKGGPTHEAFLKEYLGKSDAALQTYHRSLVFTGKASMPKTVAADAEVVAYVAKPRGAIGYVSADAPTEGVKTLEIK